VVDVEVGALDANPYPIYRLLRAEHPVAYAPALNYMLVSRWDDVDAMLKDDETFSATVAPPVMPSTLRGCLLFSDGREHARLRASMQAPCQPRPAAELADSFVTDAADELIDGFAGDGGAELVDSYFEPLGALMVAKLTGLEFPVDELRVWGNHLHLYFKLEMPPKEAQPLDLAIDAAVLDGLGHAAREPSSSLFSRMLAWHDAEGALTERQMLANVKVLLAAGVNEPRDLWSHALIGLLGRPEQLAELVSDASLARPALEEAARWASPVGVVLRLTTEQAELAGFPIPPGTIVAAIVASANRDERRWSEPSRYDLHRDEGMHLGFATGVHFCLGAWLARAAGAVALGRLLERLPGLRLASDRPLTVTGWRFREVRRLHVRWDGS
jgi:cytochrome P450